MAVLCVYCFPIAAFQAPSKADHDLTVELMGFSTRLVEQVDVKLNGQNNPPLIPPLQTR